MTRPLASVIVALNPHEGTIADTLQAYRQQAGIDGEFELVIVDNGSRPGQRRPGFDDVANVRLRWGELRKPGRAAANNAGVRAATADVLIFVADDFIPARTLVRAHIEFHRHLMATSVGIGPAYFTRECRDDAFRCWLEDSGRLFGVPFRTAATQWPRDFLYLGNASMPRELHDALGGFDETFEHDLFDDLEFSLRVAERGIRTHLLPKALAWHDHAVTLNERVQAMHRAGAAARHLDDTRQGARPWAALVEQPVEPLAERVACGADVEQARAGRFDYFSALMDLAFVRGYRGLADPPWVR